MIAGMGQDTGTDDHDAIADAKQTEQEQEERAWLMAMETWRRPERRRELLKARRRAQRGSHRQVARKKKRF